MELVFYPDPILKRRVAPLLRIDQDVKERAREMLEIMYREHGVGLAAPQVAWGTRLFVMNPAPEQEPSGERVYVNPRIVETEGEEMGEEGCLSIPDVRGHVARHRRIRIKAQDLDGSVVEEELEELPARVFQHELDHLDGILFIVRLSSSERLLVKKDLKRLEKEYQKKRVASRR